MSATHFDALPTGFILDEFRVERLLGHGGFGLTYLARDTRLNSLYAIKEFLPQGVAKRVGTSLAPTSPDQAESFSYGLRRFKEEARALARFRHPHIARVTRLLEANGTAYMVMEYEPGLTLSEFLARSTGPLNAAEALAVALPILDGLAALHDAGLIHRDIKPANVFLRARGGPMLIDFGAARSSIGGQAPLTATFTPGFAPIEQYTPDAMQGPPTDLYAYGATLYRVVTGRTPPDAVRRSAARGSGLPDPFVPATEFASEVLPYEFMECIDWALEYVYQDRPPNAHALNERLRALEIEPRDITATLVEIGAIDGATGLAGVAPNQLSSARTVPPPTARAPGMATRLMSALKELRRRKVFKVGVGYMVAGAALTQLLSAVAAPLAISPISQRFILLAMLLGFPVALLLSWALEWTPQGPRRTRDRAKGSLRQFELGLIALMTVVVGTVAMAVYRPMLAPEGIGKPIILVAMPDDLRPESSKGDQLPARVQAAVMQALAADPSVAVTSKGAATRIQTIRVPLGQALEADASHVFEFSLKLENRGEREELVVTTQLLDVPTGRSLVSYSESHRTDILVPPENDIASTVAGVSRLFLGDDGWAPGGSIRSSSEEARQLFRLAEAYRRHGIGEPAPESLKRAIAIDPHFHQATAMLLNEEAERASSRSQFLKLREKLRAVESNPIEDGYSVPTARVLSSLEEPGAALYALERAASAHQRDPYFHLLRGFILRDLGRFEEERQSYDTSAALDPYFWWPYTNIALSGLAAHDYEKSIEALLYAHSRWPRGSNWAYWRIHAGLARSGSTEAARRALEQYVEHYRPPQRSDGGINRLIQEYDLVLAWLEGDLKHAFGIAEAMGDYCPFGSGFGFVIWGLPCAEHFRTVSLLLQGDIEGARREARKIEIRLMARLAGGEHSNVSGDRLASMKLGVTWSQAILSGSANQQELEAHARHIESLNSESRPRLLMMLAWLNAWTGNEETAIRILDQLFETQWGPYPAVVARDPAWAVLYESPEFDRILLMRDVRLTKHSVKFHRPLPKQVLTTRG